MLYYLLTYLQSNISFLRVFKYITFRTALATLTAMLISFLMGPWIIKKLKQLQIQQQIREEGPKSHYKKAGTPTMGGILILIAILFPTILWANLSNKFIQILIFGCCSFGLIGFFDDYLKITKKSARGLKGKKKFLLQLLCCIVIAFLLLTLGIFKTKMNFPFIKWFQPDIGWYYSIIIILVILGSANAVNLTDGLDGLAAGTVLMAGAAYTAFAYVAGHAIFSNYLKIASVPLAGEITIYCGALVGACIGFLWFNCYPAQVFMGDVGSLPLGSSIGLIALMVKQEILLLLVGGVFVIEALSVISQVLYFKLTNGKRIFLMSPLHHHFELKGWEEPKVVTRFWIIALIFALMSLTTLKLR